jgi:hypothetical protein
MELRPTGEDGQELGAVERGWCVGSETFCKELLAQMSAGSEHYGPAVGESSKAKAGQIIQAELKSRGWREGDLER